jgi:hypothetical protein
MIDDQPFGAFCQPHRIRSADLSIVWRSLSLIVDPSSWLSPALNSIHVCWGPH